MKPEALWYPEAVYQVKDDRWRLRCMHDPDLRVFAEDDNLLERPVHALEVNQCMASGIPVYIGYYDKIVLGSQIDPSEAITRTILEVTDDQREQIKARLTVEIEPRAIKRARFPQFTACEVTPFDSPEPETKYFTYQCPECHYERQVRDLVDNAEPRVVLCPNMGDSYREGLSKHCGQLRLVEGL